MTDEDTSNLFGLDDSSLGFIDDGSASGDVKSDPSYTSDDGQFDSSGWEFPDSMPFTFDTNTSSSGVAPSYSTSIWDSPPFDQEQLSPSMFDDLSPANNDPAFLFGPPIMPMQQKQKQQQRPRQPPMQNTRQPVTTLTPAAQEKLRNIAMPPHLQYHSPKSASSPESSAGINKADSQSPPPDGKDGKPKSKKRKMSEDDHDDDEEEEDEDGKPIKKTSHNMIEKRYRNNLNDKIAALRDSVPSLRIMSKSARGEDTTEDRQELHGLTPAHKLNKATVGDKLVKAKATLLMRNRF